MPDSVKYESIRCQVNPEHRRAGSRVSPLSVLLPNIEPYDFVWTPFECLIQERVLQVLEHTKLTGFEAVKAEARFANSAKSAPTFWELVVKGSAGLVSAESGYKLLGICPGCGLIDNASKITNSAKMVDQARWDGSDFFKLEPVSGLIFMTPRVVGTLNEAKFRGWKAYSPSELQADLDDTIIVSSVNSGDRSHLN
ncbi:MAG TPA: double-CXXCG motif protein [Candidatus Acidoferrum sp.]